VLIVLVAVLLGTRPWAPGSSPAPSPVISASSLGGLSLTGYCSTLGPQGAQDFHVSGQDCVQRVNMNAACDFQYQATDLKAQFTSPDPDSAICYNAHVTHNNGISNMAGYCATQTTMAGVTATDGNPEYENIWVCQVAINKNLACDIQNYRTGLVAREVGKTWSCYE
jgi:hypothetical protein